MPARQLTIVSMSRWKRSRVFGSALLLTVGLSACGGDDSGAEPVDASTDAAPRADQSSPLDATHAASEAAAEAASLLDAGSEAAAEAASSLDASDTGQPDAPSSVAAPAGRGSAVQLSADDRHLLAANRDANSVTIFDINYPPNAPPQFVKKTELPAFCQEPWQVAMLPDNDTALVVCRRDQKVVKIKGVSTIPVAAGEIKLGSEPTGIALSPTGKTAWVTTWVDGLLQAVDTATLTAAGTVDLNAALAQAGYLGAVTGRPALAHPRSIVMTNNGDAKDDDESAYVTEYFSQQKQALAADGQNADLARVGVVYKVVLATKTATIIELPALADMGFRDYRGGQAGCFPNQVQSIDIRGPFAYVLSVCASPKGPVGVFTGPTPKSCASDDSQCPGQVLGSCVATKCTTNCEQNADCGSNGGKCTANKCETNIANVRTLTAPVVSTIDLAAGATVATSSLNATFAAMYDARVTPDTEARRYPHLANDIAFVPGSNTAYITANAADGAFRVTFGATPAVKAIDSVGADPHAFIDLKPAAFASEQLGRMPLGMAITHGSFPAASAQRYGFVLNENTRNVQVVDLAKDEIAGASAGVPVVAISAAQPTDAHSADVREGKRLFNTGLDRWSLNGQAWSSCQTCHVDGLTDNVTWFFPKGARQAISLDGTFAKADATNVRIASWTAAVDEISDLESVLRNTNGGVGAIVSSEALTPASRIAFDKVGVGHGGLSGSSMAVADPSNPAGLAVPSVLDDWKKVVTYITTIRSPRAPANLSADQIAAGKALFQAGNCQGCHSGPKWTISRRFYAPDPTNIVNNQLMTLSWTATVEAAGFPATLLPASTPSSQTMRYNGSNPALLDQLTCGLRNVGTFGQAETGVGVAEFRQDMTTPSQGNEADGRGYNIPSLLGLATAAPYFHAGNARTLEGLLSDSFSVHRNAFTPGFLDGAAADRASKVAQLVQFLLSLDGDATALDVPALGATGGVFCAAP